MKINFLKLICLPCFLIFLTQCNLAPEYQRPCVEIPENYKEIPKGWKLAQPQDNCKRGDWWTIFKDPILNDLMCHVCPDNQNVAIAFANYRESRAVVDVARSAFFPVIIGQVEATREKLSNSRGFAGVDTLNTSGSNGSNITTGTSDNSFGGGLNNQSRSFSNYLVALEANWELDLWGRIQNTVVSAKKGAEASLADFALVKLSMQSLLAQSYYAMRALDSIQALLDETVDAYEKALKLTTYRYKEGIVSSLDVVQAKTQLETAKTAAIDNGIARAKFEHAIAVLIGRVPSHFSICPKPLTKGPPKIPLEIPALLLERRPDIAEAERLVEQANANVGVAIAAYFPTINLSANAGYQSNHLKNLFTKPASFWSVGSALTETLFDGGLRNANKRIACSALSRTVASYRQTVLSAFQEVEDNLVSFRKLSEEVIVQRSAVANAEQQLKLTMNRYKAGIISYTDVIIAQNILYNSRKTAADIAGRQMQSAILLVKSMGGGFDSCDLNSVCRD